MIFDDFLEIYQKKIVVQYNNAICERPLISISVVTYQHLNYIKECLDSILMQETNFQFEILLGEDESTDGTREICIEYAEKYPDKIRLFLHHRENNIKINGNPTGRFNFLYNLYNARGKYIAICEGDDYWTDPLKLQKQVDFLEANPDYGLCFHPVKIYIQNSQKFKEEINTRKVTETTNIKDLAWGNYINTTSSLFRNDFDFPEWFIRPALGDWAIFMLQVKDRKIKRLDCIMAVYRVHDTGVLASKDIRDIREMSRESVRVILENAELPDKIRKILFRRLNRNKMSRFKLELNWLLKRFAGGL